MTPEYQVLLDKVRQRAWHFLSCDIAVSAGLTLSELQQIPLGGFTPDESTTIRLARRFGVL